MSTTAPAQAKVHYPLGWLRGLAALSVVLFHAYQYNRVAPTWQWPWEGPAHQAMLGTDLFVDMFFVLSGIVLWLPIARAAVSGEPGPSGRTVLYRRMARLLPLYLVLVAVVWAVTNPTLPGHWQDLVLHLTFTHVYSDTYIFWTNGPAWSLAVEFHFYLLVALAAPLVTRAVRRAATRRGRVVAAAALPVVLIGVTLAYLAWATLTHQEHTNWSIWFSPLSRAADFGIGMLLAVLVTVGVRLGTAWRRALAVLGLGATVALVIVRPVDAVVGEWWHPLYALTIATGLASVVLHDGPWPAWMSWRPLAWVGGLGYGIYLIHEPVMRFLGHVGVLPAQQSGWFFLVTAVIVAVPSVLLAWVSSRTVEAAGLRMLAVLQRDGTPRDYYAHMDQDQDQDRDRVAGRRVPQPA